MENRKKLERTLCGMLPYGLKLSLNTTSPSRILPMVACYKTLEPEISLDDAVNGLRGEYKPILHSLDKLTEPILEGGLIPMEIILEDWNSLIIQGKPYTKKDLPKNPAYMENWIVEQLKEWHFNIYDLPKEMYIEKSEQNGL